MNAVIKHILSDRILALTFWGSLLFLILYSLLLVITFEHLPPLLPIFNQMPWGINRVGNRIELLIPFGIAFGVFVCNTTIAASVYHKLPLVARMLSLTASFAALLALLFFLRTLLVVFW